jgi:hypothetical protein
MFTTMQGFIQWGMGGFTPGMNLIWGDIPPPPHQLEVFGILFSGFENIITLTNSK